MAPRDLRAFVKQLEQAGELRRVSTQVSPHLEITEIADRVMKSGGPALLFENVEGSTMPLLINAFGSRRRMSIALGVDDLDEHAQRIRKLVTMAPPSDLAGKLRALGDLKDIATIGPRSVSNGPCQEVIVPEPSLKQLPVLTCW